MSDGRSQGWCFTLNNPGDQEFDQLVKDTKYSIYGKETGESGTFHYQGYVYFPTKKSLKQVKGYIQKAHWEIQRGTFEQAIEYCKKDNDFIENGEMPMSKKRKGDLGKQYWEEQLAHCKKGRIDLVDPKLQLTQMGSLLKAVSFYAEMPPDLESYNNQWFCGPTGTGKSFTARNENPGCYLKMCNKWWDGYKGEEVVLIEDFDKCHSVLGHHLKIWADRYAFPAEVKGAKLNLRPKKIIVTSNYHPEEIWPASTDSQTLEPIERRFDITRFHNKL